MPYQVKDWSVHFENDRSKERDRCSFVCVPNKQHGMGFSYLMAEKDGAALYGIWQMIVGACSQQKRPRQGWLTSDGTASGIAWAVEDLAVKFRRPVAEIARAVEVLCSARVGWLVFVQVVDGKELPPTPYANTTESPSTPLEGKGKEGKEEKGKEGSATAPPLEVPVKLRTQKFLNAWERWQTFRRGMKRMKNWLELFGAQLQYLERFEVETATEMLEQSIRNGWLGIFELKDYGNRPKTPNGTDRPNPRNAGTIKGTTDYGEAGRRKLERQREEREKGSVAGQMAENAPASPPTEGAGR